MNALPGVLSFINDLSQRVSWPCSIWLCPVSASSALPRCAKANAVLMNNAGSAAHVQSPVDLPGCWCLSGQQWVSRPLLLLNIVVLFRLCQWRGFVAFFLSYVMINRISDIYIQNKLLENVKFHHFLTFSRPNDYFTVIGRLLNNMFLNCSFNT